MERVNGMEELQLISRQHPGEVSIDNFFEMKVALTHALARYENVVYTEDMLADSKADKKELPVCARNSTTGGKRSKKPTWPHGTCGVSRPPAESTPAPCWQNIWSGWNWRIPIGLSAMRRPMWVTEGTISA